MEPVLWKDVVDMGREAIEKYPFEKVLWYPSGGLSSNEFIHILISFVFQWIPAYFIDFVMTLIGQPRL